MRWIGAVGAAWALMGCAMAQTADMSAPEAEWRRVDPENLVILETTTGPVAIELAAEAAPKHVAEFRQAVRAGTYDGEYFYRVIEGHVAQAGLEFEKRLGDWPLLPLEASRNGC